MGWYVHIVHTHSIMKTAINLLINKLEYMEECNSFILKSENVAIFYSKRWGFEF